MVTETWRQLPTKWSSLNSSSSTNLTSDLRAHLGYLRTVKKSRSHWKKEYLWKVVKCARSSMLGNRKKWTHWRFQYWLLSWPNTACMELHTMGCQDHLVMGLCNARLSEKLQLDDELTLPLAKESSVNYLYNIGRMLLLNTSKTGWRSYWKEWSISWMMC